MQRSSTQANKDTEKRNLNTNKNSVLLINDK